MATDPLVAEFQREAEEQRARAERAESLVARYRRPLPDGGWTWQERAHTLKVKLVDAEAERDRYRQERDMLARGVLKADGASDPERALATLAQIARVTLAENQQQDPGGGR